MSTSGTPAANTATPPMVKIFRAANKVVRPLLASRFHKPLSGRLMLLTYNGHRTGREFTVPIGYFDWDPGTVLAMSSRLSWIPSMRQGSPVRLRIRGQDHAAVPTVVEDPEEVAALLAEFGRRKGPKAAKGLMLGLPGDRQPTDDELRTAAAKTRLVCFRMEPERPGQ
ncbi:hypothetical protein [Streptomyces europaeiscabiei]|uniref:hypothetical protein n=1 Tax=Streptomyces europaeiscabiei TaxID=146819 RepID=UPI0029BDFD06|nr:hypothetical protein [Streptomyces europaeiscabiei]MDX3841282.1 hypothetical protein [Streptomyces europaeiscabiei]